MPQWLYNQLMRAFYNKNHRQIRLLNDCWFFYRKKESGRDNPETRLKR